MNIKSLLLFLLLTTTFLPDVQACSICGCASGANYNGILPQYRKNIIAFRNRYRAFDQSVKQNGTYLNSTYTYSSYELWGRIYLKDRIQFFFSLPYSVNTLNDKDGQSTLSGINDLSVQVNYNLINTTFDTNRVHTVQHNLLIGGGVKLPTGKYQQRNKQDVMYQENFQTGSGAFSYLGSIIYNVRYRKMGLNADINYIYNTANELKYAFGNQFTASLGAFAWLKKGEFSFLPNTGVFYEKLDRDIRNGVYNTLSGGYALNYNLGTDVYYKNVFVGATFQTPVVQEIGSDQIKYKAKYMINVGFLF
ncbi:MAG: hypothetical protein JWM14_1256 [Chitinophagaceae bacterium]|nr:hypothetical protein [Chitinophagaceae bacterium]